MIWTDMVVSKRIGVGFGLILFLFAVVGGGVSFYGVKKIVSDAKEVIATNRLDSVLSQGFKEISVIFTRAGTTIKPTRARKHPAKGGFETRPWQGGGE